MSAPATDDHAAPVAPRADLITAAVFLVFGAAVVIACLNMPTFTDQGTPIYVAPGLVPGFHGVMIIVLSLILAGRAFARGLSVRPARAPYNIGKCLLAVLLTTLFIGGLIGRLPFWAAAALFVFVFVMAFEWPAEKPVVTGGIAAAIGLVAGVAITALFQSVFLIQMP